MSERIHNFGAGPGVLPEPVLRQAQQDLWDIGGSGIGIMEHSHRGKLFDRVIGEAEALCREVGGVPASYKVLFLQGGASLQFSMVPMNLLPAGRTADYVVTGVWSQKALKEAKLLGQTHVAFDGAGNGFTRIPRQEEIRYSDNPCYVHVTTNNTIYGTQWREEPAVPAGVPMIADTSSDMYSRPIDIAKYGLIYAGAQKNLGPSGVVLVIIRDDLLELAPKTLPTMLQYRTHAAENSLYNTPNTWGIYFTGQVFKWIKEQGGLPGMAARNQAKAKLLYDVIDGSGFYRGTAETDSRSLMNVTFRIEDRRPDGDRRGGQSGRPDSGSRGGQSGRPDSGSRGGQSGRPSWNEELEAKFCSEATKAGLDGLKGHRSAGGMRASIYNACPLASVQALVEFMREFERRNG